MRRTLAVPAVLAVAAILAPIAWAVVGGSTTSGTSTSGVGDAVQSSARTPAARTTGVEGVIYTTWRNDYKNLEAFAKVLRREL